MTPLTQTKILRVLQEQQFERVGGNETIQTDVRVIAATNRDLEQLVAAGRFRSDLYYRLNVYTIRLPPLRERGEDLPLLVDALPPAVRPRAGEGRRTASPPRRWTMLRRYPWPGNVRELQSVLKQALVQTNSPILAPESLAPAISAAAHRRRHTASLPSDAVDLGQFLEHRLTGGHGEPLRRVARPDGAGPAHPGPPPHRGEPGPGGEDAGH